MEKEQLLKSQEVKVWGSLKRQVKTSRSQIGKKEPKVNTDSFSDVPVDQMSYHNVS